MSLKEQKLERKAEKVKKALKLLNVVEQIKQWGYDRGIIQANKPLSQWEKTLEEVNELKEAIEKNDKEAIDDAIGDTIVTLIMQAEIQKVNITSSLEKVFQIINKRKGKLVNGSFVKDND